MLPKVLLHETPLVGIAPVDEAHGTTDHVAIEVLDELRSVAPILAVEDRRSSQSNEKETRAKRQSEKTTRTPKAARVNYRAV